MFADMLHGTFHWTTSGARSLRICTRRGLCCQVLDIWQRFWPEQRLASGTPPWTSKALPHRQDQRVATFTLGFIHLTLCARCSPATPPPPCQTGFSCGDDFWFHYGLLPERGGERGQTYQLRDRETAAARQERCKKGAQAAAAGWVWKSGQS